MQNGWIRYVRGCLEIRLGGDYIERFLNMCRMHDIELWDIRKEDELCVCQIYASDFFKMPPLLRKTGTRADVLKKKGLPFYFPFIKKRIIFFVGVFLCLALLNRATDYVWAIEYVGNLQVSDDELTDFLAQEGIHYGMKKNAINCDEKEKRLRETFQNVTWTSIYFEGTKLYVELKENEKSEPVVVETKGTDIIADEAGTIVSIITRNGVPQVKAGDTVEEGQVLVSGSVPIYDENQTVIHYQVYDADADILIQTLMPYRDAIGSSYPVIYYTGNDICVRFVEMMGYRLDGLSLYDFFYDLVKGKRTSLYETTTEKKQAVLLDHLYLPVYYGKIDRKEYYIRYLTYTQEEMENILSDNFEKFISGLQEKEIQIVEKNVKMVQNRSGMEFCGDLLVIKPTGEPAEIVPDDLEIEKEGTEE